MKKSKGIDKIKRIVFLGLIVSILVMMYLWTCDFRMDELISFDADKAVDQFITRLLEQESGEKMRLLRDCEYNIQNMLILLGCKLSGSAIAGMNLYYILSFYFIAFAAYWYLRRIGSSYLMSCVGAVILMLLPFHVDRGQGQIVTSSFFLIPIFAGFIYEHLYLEREERKYDWIWLCMAPFMDARQASMLFILLVVLCLHRHSQNSLKKWLPLLIIMLVLSLGLRMVTREMPWMNMKESIELARSEGLRLLDLVVPFRYHVYDRFMNIRYDYDVSFGASGESGLNSMGVMLSVAFVWGSLKLFLDKREGEYISYMCFINILVLVLCSVGGFGLILECLGVQIIYWNRLGILMIVHAAAVMALEMDKICLWIEQRTHQWVSYAVVLLISGLSMVELILRH